VTEYALGGRRRAVAPPQACRLARRDPAQALLRRAALACPPYGRWPAYAAASAARSPRMSVAAYGALAALRQPLYIIEPVLAAWLALGIAPRVLARAAWPRPAARRSCAARASWPAWPALPETCHPATGVLHPGTAYWHRRPAGLVAQTMAPRHLVVPADSHASTPGDKLMRRAAGTPGQLTVAEAEPGPFSAAAVVSDLLDGAEQAIEAGTASPAWRYLTLQASVCPVRNDLDPPQPRSAPPAARHTPRYGRRIRPCRVGSATRADRSPSARTVPAGRGARAGVPAGSRSSMRDPPDRPGGPAVLLPAGADDVVDGGPASLRKLTCQGLLGPVSHPCLAGRTPPPTRPPVCKSSPTPARADTPSACLTQHLLYVHATGTIPPDARMAPGATAPSSCCHSGPAGHQNP